MSINNLVLNLKFKIEDIVTDYEAKIKLTDEEKNVLNHAYSLKNNFEELCKKIKLRIPKATETDVNKIKADINSLLDVINSDKINSAKKIYLLEYGVGILVNNYEKIIQDNKTLEEKIRAVKAKRDALRREEQDLLRDINEKIERIKKSKELKKSIEQHEQKERSERISGVMEKVNTKKELLKKEEEPFEDASYMMLKQEKYNKEKKVIDNQITDVPKKNKQLVKSNNRRKKESIIQRIKNKIKSIKSEKSKKEKKSKHKRKSPWAVAIPLAGVFAVSIGSQAGLTNNQNSKTANEKKFIDEDNSQNENEKLQIETTTEKYDVEFENNTQAATKQTITEHDNKNEKSTDNYNENVKKDDNKTLKNDVIKTQKEVSKEHSPEEVVVNIGDKVVIDTGVSYAQTCFGEGNVGVIGDVSWRPSTEYSVEKVAFFHDGQLLGLVGENTESINSKIKKYAEECDVDEKDIDIKVLISLVPGSYDTGWASLNIEQMQNNIVEHEVNTGKNNSRKQEINNIER